MARDYGGHAYPMVGQLNNDQYICEFGMTLRDWFAGQALNGILSGYWSNPAAEGLTQELLAKEAYGLADAMIAERNK